MKHDKLDLAQNLVAEMNKAIIARSMLYRTTTETYISVDGSYFPIQTGDAICLMGTYIDSIKKQMDDIGLEWDE